MTGPQMALGYWGRPGEDGGRVRHAAGGNRGVLPHRRPGPASARRGSADLPRAPRQPRVKIRGYRVELGEIEAALRREAEAGQRGRAGLAAGRRRGRGGGRGLPRRHLGRHQSPPQARVDPPPALHGSPRDPSHRRVPLEHQRKNRQERFARAFGSRKRLANVRGYTDGVDPRSIDRLPREPGEGRHERRQGRHGAVFVRARRLVRDGGPARPSSRSRPAPAWGRRTSASRISTPWRRILAFAATRQSA